MKILVTHPLHPQLVKSGLGEIVTYQPELADQPEDALRQALSEQAPDGLLIGKRTPNPKTLQAWRGAATRPTIQLVHRNRQEDSPDGGSRGELLGIDVTSTLGEPGDLSHDVIALGTVERNLIHSRSNEQLAGFGISKLKTSPQLSGSRVTLVGAGIINLMTACDLVQHGASVDILDMGPDPRTKPPWQRLGATHGGGNARMFCFTEARNYNQKIGVADTGMNEVFRRQITESGWLTVAPGELDENERAWIRNFDRLPCWRAEVFNADIHNFNITSGALWNSFQKSSPHLFEDVGLVRDVLCLYSQAKRIEAAKALHSRIGSLLRSLDPDELSRRHPALCDAVESGEIAGGLEIQGFTLNIHPFVEKLLAYLEKHGVRFHWNRKVTAIERDHDGSVTGLQTSEGRTDRSDHYVLSPGAHGDPALSGTRSAGKVQGILGLWMLLPNLDPQLRCSIKIHREGHVGEDSNVILATDDQNRPILSLASGYGYIGTRQLDMSSPEISHLFDALEKTALRFFPRAYRQAVKDGMLKGQRKACVRPFTSTGLGILEVDRTAEGGRLLIASGHNTGGFTQAPVVAEAIAATLGGAVHPMQGLYEPERGLTP